MRTLLPCLLFACGGSGGGGDQPAADASVDGGSTDLSSATWELTPVGVRPASLAFRPDLAITASGEVVVVWPDLIDELTGETPILMASSAAGFAEEVRSGPGALSRARPALSVAGERIHLVYDEDSGATNNDVFYARRDTAWTAPINLTGPRDIDNLVEIDPTAVESGGVTTVFYIARLDSGFEPAGLFAVSFTDPGDPGPVQTILDPADFNCHEIEAVSDGETIHLIAECNEGGGASGLLFYLNDRSGGFVRQTVDLGATHSPLSPDITLGPDGAVHLVWVGSHDCPAGSCRDVFHSRDLSPPVSVTGQSEDGGTDPVVTVDGLGRTIVAFHRFGFDDVLWTYAEPGSGFVRTLIATAGTGDTRDAEVGGLEINPITGRAHMAFVSTAAGNADVVHGELR